VTDDVVARCSLYTTRYSSGSSHGRAAVASGAQLAIPLAIDPGCPDETARPDYHAYCGTRRRPMMDGKET